ncbi:MAG: hypothetical protein WBE48_11035 [Xanthobacteraceae bacterium]
MENAIGLEGWEEGRFLGGIIFSKARSNPLALFVVVNAKITSDFLKPLILLFLTWHYRLFCRGGFCHMASQ